MGQGEEQGAGEGEGLASPEAISSLLAKLELRPSGKACVMPGGLPHAIRDYFAVRCVVARARTVRCCALGCWPRWLCLPPARRGL